MQNIGQVIYLFRYPIKSMGGEKLESSIITKKGFLGDRAYALIDTKTNKIVSAKNPKKWKDIFKYHSKYISEPIEDNLLDVQITFPDKTIVNSTQKDVDTVLSSTFDGTLKLTSTPPKTVQLEEYYADIEEVSKNGIADETILEGTFFDLGAIHIITTATLKKCEELYGEGDFNLDRFRPNILIDLDSDEIGFIENDWIGKEIHIGDEVILKVKRSCPRCVMTTLEQDSVKNDVNVLKTIIKNNEGNLGIYADVICGGCIKNTDKIKVI